MNKLQLSLVESLGLSDYQAQLYIAGLSFDRATLSDLAKKAGVPRTAAYEPLKKLIQLGFLSMTRIGKRDYYQALDPKQLLLLYDRRRTELESTIGQLQQHIESRGEGLAVTYFPGHAGVMASSDRFLEQSRPRESWRTLEDPDAALRTFGEGPSKEYQRRRLAKKISGRVILPGNASAPFVRERIARDVEELRQTVLVSPTQYPIEASIGISEDQVLIYTARGEPFSLIIKNKAIARTLASLHAMAWDRYHPVG